MKQKHTVTPLWALKLLGGQCEVTLAGSQTSWWVCILSRPWLGPTCFCLSAQHCPGPRPNCRMAMSPAISELCSVFTGRPIDPCWVFLIWTYFTKRAFDASDNIRHFYLLQKRGEEFWDLKPYECGSSEAKCWWNIRNEVRIKDKNRQQPFKCNTQSVTHVIQELG